MSLCFPTTLNSIRENVGSRCQRQAVAQGGSHDITPFYFAEPPLSEVGHRIIGSFVQAHCARSVARREGVAAVCGRQGQ